jgi:hypothetical protein
METVQSESVSLLLRPLVKVERPSSVSSAIWEDLISLCPSGLESFGLESLLWLPTPYLKESKAKEQR